MDRLYGYRWPDTLLGQRIAEIHFSEDAQMTRQYATLRFVGVCRRWPIHMTEHTVVAHADDGRATLRNKGVTPAAWPAPRPGDPCGLPLGPPRDRLASAAHGC